MGQGPRAKPKRLPEKLLQIREQLGLSQSSLVQHLGLSGQISRAKISEFERGEREPILTVLLQYSRAAGVCMDVLVDDALDLPAKLPSLPKHQGVPQKLSSKKLLKH